MQVVTINGTLHLSSESREDARTLERVVSQHEIAGCGRHPETGELLHVELAIPDALLAAADKLAHIALSYDGERLRKAAEEYRRLRGGK